MKYFLFNFDKAIIKTDRQTDRRTGKRTNLCINVYEQQEKYNNICRLLMNKYACNFICRVKFIKLPVLLPGE